MKFADVLKDGCYCLSLRSDTKRGVIEEMVDLLAAAGKIRDRDAVLKAVMERERKMSTGMQFGVAIPHGKTDSVDRLVSVVALKKEGIEFGSLDGKPARIFIMTVSPVSQTGPHMQYLTEISKVLNSEDVRNRILSAASEEELLGILTNGHRRHDTCQD